MLTLDRKETLRRTVAGGANNTARLTAALPDTADLSLELYLLNQPLFQLVCCTDPDVATVEQWKAKAKTYSTRLLALGQRLNELATA